MIINPGSKLIETRVLTYSNHAYLHSHKEIPMRYSVTVRTYNPSDCTSTGYLIQANKNFLKVTSRSCWQGSREHVWYFRDLNGKGEEMATNMVQFEQQPERSSDGITLEEAYGLDPDCADRVGKPIR
jgi:hypothetical protein